MNKRLSALPLLAGAALLATVATRGNAHHAFAAEFDAAKPVAIEGAITKVRYVNPHSWIYLDVKDKSGTVTNWGFEFGTPSSLRTNGLDKDSLPIGSQISISGFRAKNGGPFGYATTVGLSNGRKVRTGGGAPDAPTAPAR